MSEICETVTIETENGPVDINKSDLTKDHKLCTGKSEGSISGIPAKIADIRAALTERGIEFDADLGKPELKELLESAILAESD